jgi:ferrous iron transport protein B
MEMPKYRMPSTKLLWHTVYSKSLSYLKKAGTFILAASVLIWFASNYPKNLDIQKDFEAKISKSIDEEKKKSLQQELQKKLLENSYLGITGKATQWIFEPIGLNWQLTVALESGLAAKEVVVSTLGVLYSLGEDVDEENSSLLNAIRKNIPFASAVSFIIFVMIYLPCLAASMVFMKEAGGARYLVYLFAFTTIVAYVMAFIGYKIATLV